MKIIQETHYTYITSSCFFPASATMNVFHVGVETLPVPLSANIRRQISLRTTFQRLVVKITFYQRELNESKCLGNCQQVGPSDTSAIIAFFPNRVTLNFSRENWFTGLADSRNLWSSLQPIRKRDFNDWHENCKTDCLIAIVF